MYTNNVRRQKSMLSIRTVNLYHYRSYNNNSVYHATLHGLFIDADRIFCTCVSSNLNSCITVIIYQYIAWPYFPPTPCSLKTPNHR